MKADREERYWSRFARSYDADGEYVVGKPILQAIEEALSKEQTLGDAIEFGCGTGYFTRAVARNARHVVATDLSDAMLDVARAKLRDFENVTIEKADCAHTSFSAESFDSVVMINLIHVIDDAPQCLQESHRILRTGGALIAVDLTGFRMRFLGRMKLGFRYVMRWGLPPRGGQNKMGPDELAILVERAGFTVEDIQLLEDGANALYLRGAKAQARRPAGRCPRPGLTGGSSDAHSGYRGDRLLLSRGRRPLGAYGGWGSWGHRPILAQGLTARVAMKGGM